MIDGSLKNNNVDELILTALKEDVTYDDVTTMAIMPEPKQGEVDLICKQDGILAGLSIFRRSFELVGDVEIETSFKDGDAIKYGDLIAKVRGDIRVLLIGERTALNYLQRMSGIATFTNEMVAELAGTKTKLLDTRKTTPGMRVFEKYAVKVGGGTNHRFNLTDGVLIKDNHIGAAGSIKAAVEACREYAPFVRKIEVEVETLDQVKEAIDAKADIIMLDNMDNETTKKAVDLINGTALVEASGNMTLERIRSVAETGVDYISVGALTHSVKALDISMKDLKNL